LPASGGRCDPIWQVTLRSSVLGSSKQLYAPFTVTVGRTDGVTGTGVMTGGGELLMQRRRELMGIERMG